jgi:hypothetical protein
MQAKINQNKFWICKLFITKKIITLIRRDTFLTPPYHSMLVNLARLEQKMIHSLFIPSSLPPSLPPSPLPTPPNPLPTPSLPLPTPNLPFHASESKLPRLEPNKTEICLFSHYPRVT